MSLEKSEVRNDFLMRLFIYRYQANSLYTFSELSNYSNDITGSDIPVDCGVLAEVVPTVSEVDYLNNDENIEFLSCCGNTND